MMILATSTFSFRIEEESTSSRKVENMERIVTKRIWDEFVEGFFDIEGGGLFDERDGFLFLGVDEGFPFLDGFVEGFPFLDVVDEGFPSLDVIGGFPSLDTLVGGFPSLDTLVGGLPGGYPLLNLLS